MSEEVADPQPSGGPAKSPDSPVPVSENKNDHQEENSSSTGQQVSLQKIQELLKTKDDTSRFVGLALLKSVLDNSPDLREDEASITALWGSISVKFVDRLLRTGAGHANTGKRKDAKDMLDLAVAVLHTFTVFLPEQAKREAKLTGRIPILVNAILSSSEATTQLILQTLLTLVSFPEGAQVFAGVDDLSPLIEIAPSQPLVLDILEFAWLNSMTVVQDATALSSRIDKSIQSLVASFKGTDAVTLLTFLAKLLGNLDTHVVPPPLDWLKPVIGFIRNLVTSRPTAAGRAAYTNLSATLLQVYPSQAPRLLFSEDASTGSEKPFSFLLVNLLLIDLRSSFPALLGQLNSPEYADISRRLASAFDVVSAFIGFLVRYMDGDSMDVDAEGAHDAAHMMAPDLLLKLRKAISETMSVTIEFLRDRWDASVAGALGLHPDARAAAANTASGASRLTIPWESKAAPVGGDPLVLAAVRALAIWLREDDNDVLRGEAAGLADMLVDLYRTSAAGAGLDFRRAVLVAVEGIVAAEDGAEALLAEGAWDVLAQDMLAALRATSASPPAGPSPDLEAASARGIEIVRVLLPIVEAEQPGPREAWMDVVTQVAAWDVPEGPQASAVVRDFQAAVLQLVAALVVGAHPGMRRRYVHSMSAVVGIVRQLRRNTEEAGVQDPGLLESLEDVETTLNALR
ncbi:DUF1941 family protein [Pleurostoma richardsiae]|uniref:DUF1941 family protein n=1 Tax=Pleurostoma richardsiae TaxID=41990 RepID=A0AA38VJ18_9PEZI|nr:DUF1941 family protein [Pleurostoma richardsiae]